MRQYDEVVPGTAERLLLLAEKQAEHRREIEHLVVKSDGRLQEWGQRFAFALALIGIGGGLYLLNLDKPIGGLAAVMVAACWPLAILLRRRRVGRRNVTVP